MSPSAARLETVRLFLALWPDSATRAELADWRDRCRWPAQAAIVATPRLHLTLHFIGAVAEDRLEDIATGVRVEPPPRFELQFDKIAVWPHGLVVLPAGAAAPPQLVGLHRALAAALHALQLPVETRRFAPHVTLARNADAAELAERRRPLRWRVEGYALVRSHLGGSERAHAYEVVRRYR